jgi:FixJ family two-component response regulator
MPTKFKLTISIVDDDESVREATEAQMKSFGYDAHTFSSSAEFLGSSGIENTSCMIVDINMPRMTGLELRDRLLELGHRIPTVFITGYPSDEDRARALAGGVVCYLVKPYNDEDLLHCVRLATERRAR